MWSWRNEALANSVCSGIIRTGIKIPALKQQAKQHQHAFHSPDGADTGGPWGPNPSKMQAPHSGRDPALKKHIEACKQICRQNTIYIINKSFKKRSILRVIEGQSTFSFDLQSKLTCKYEYQHARTCTFIHKHTCVLK